MISNEAKELLDDDLDEHSDFGQVDYVSFSGPTEDRALNESN